MPKINLTAYDRDGFFDEMMDEDGQVRPHYAQFQERLKKMDWKKLSSLQFATDRAQLSMGMTFNVYNDNQGVERILHLDIIPRIISSDDWEVLERGLRQRIVALNLFIDDLYHDQKILKDKIIPSELVLSSATFLKQCVGLNPPRKVWCHITGSDLIRGGDGAFYVLEDNLRCPSGVSYMLENREILKRTFPEIFEKLRVRPVADYSHHLRDTLESLVPHTGEVTIVVLTPGAYNSAYFEHAYLAQQMGAELVEGRDLVVKNDIVYMATPGAYSGWTSSTDGWTTITWTPRHSAKIRCWVRPACSGLTRKETWCWSTHRAPEWPTTKPCTPTSRRSSNTTWARKCSCPTCRLTSVPTPKTCNT
jgi:uncharacterized circularly permuted ATP-grasp superfamily protein